MNQFVRPEVGCERAPDTNQEFYEFVFGQHAWVWGCAFQPCPNHKKKKFGSGKFAQLPASPIKENAEVCNTYYSISSYREISGQRQRSTPFFEALYVVPIDDVGTKGRSLEDICKVLPPTYALETSEETENGKVIKNYQVGYVLSEPEVDLAAADLIVKSLGKSKGDKSGNNVVRVVRLPYGMNTKCGADSKSPCGETSERSPTKVLLEEWTGIKYTTQQIMDAFGIQPLADNVIPMSVTSLAGTRPDWMGTGSDKGNEFVEAGDTYRKFTLDEIRDALTFIDAGKLAYDGDDPDATDSAPTFVAVLMAVHSAYPCAEGMAVADEWASAGEKYQEDEVSGRWGGFGDRQGVTIATLVKFARAAGWVPSMGFSERDRIIGEFGAKYAVVKIGNKVRILVENTTTNTPDIPPYNLLTEEDFHRWCATHVFMDPTDSKWRPLSKAWVRWPYRKEYDGIGCYPPPHPVPPGCYNTWHGFAVKPSPGDCSLWHDHLLNVYYNGDRSLYEWTVKWFAALVQYPGAPVGSALACRGEEGTGKGAMWHPFIKIFGTHCVQFVDQTHMESQFGGALEDKVLVINNEAYWGGNSKASGKIKGLITERYVVSERKGIEARTVFNPLWFGFMSNSDYYIPADESSRRFMAAEISEAHKQDASYFVPLFKQMDSGGIEALLYELLSMSLTEHDLKHLLPNPPVTRALKKQGSQTYADFANWIQHMAIGGECHGIRDPDSSTQRGGYPYLISGDAWRQFVEYRKEFGHFAKTKTTSQFGKFMRAVGAIPAKPRIGPGGKQMRCYELPPLGEFRESVLEHFPSDDLEIIVAEASGDEWHSPRGVGPHDES